MVRRAAVSLITSTLLVQLQLGVANMDLAHLKFLAKNVFINGDGPAYPGVLDQAQVDTIDRELFVSYDQSELSLNNSCGEWSCPPSSFDVTLGMPVTAPMVSRAPRVAWRRSPGKQYTLVMMDTLSPAFINILGNMTFPGFRPGQKQICHSKTAGSDISFNNSWFNNRWYRPIGNPITEAPSVYGFFLFEQDTATVEAGAKGVADTMKGHIRACAPGLHSAKLVGLNWFKGYGNIYTLSLLSQYPSFGQVVRHAYPHGCGDVLGIPLCFAQTPNTTLQQANSIASMTSSTTILSPALRGHRSGVRQR
jgi:hypothetical protein